MSFDRSKCPFKNQNKICFFCFGKARQIRAGQSKTKFCFDRSGWNHYFNFSTRLKKHHSQISFVRQQQPKVIMAKHVRSANDSFFKHVQKAISSTSCLCPTFQSLQLHSRPYYMFSLSDTFERVKSMPNTISNTLDKVLRLQNICTLVAFGTTRHSRARN